MKKTFCIYIFTLMVFISCSESKKEKTETNAPTEKEIKKSDSLVNNDKQRADSMMNALKEKLK